ncbi:MAG: N-6 DNA methylase [Bacteroidia bacterium]|nr:N-6 DNA methylase [Bacteroidia bacterium]
MQIVSREELIRALQKCHDTVWQAGKLAPTVAFDEVSKLLFCKLKDEKETKKNSFYKFQVGTNETPKDVFGRIDTIYQNSKKGNGDVFNENIKLDEKIVYSVVEHLQELAINKIDLDTKGIAFERFMEDFFKGKMGQFFTPRAIIKFCIDVIAPKFSDKILDPACGSGGFLLNSLDLIRKFSEDNYEQIEGDRLWHNFAMNNLYGIEINEQIARVCKMNMIIHDDGHTNIISTDSLQKFSKIQDIHKKFCANSFDIIFTNPPFGADIIQKEKDDGFIEQFELGSKKKKRTRQISEILFIERCIEFLKEGTGLMAIVLPDKITVNTSLQYVRDFLLEKAQIIAIISLPDFAFSHFDANVKSSVIFLRKKYPNESLDNYNILMAKPSSIGYKATGKDDINNDLIAITDYLRKFIENNYNIKIDKKVNNKIFTLTLKDVINNRLDPNAYHHEILEFKNQIVKSHLPKLKLSDCLSKSVAGEWGEDPEKFFPDENYQLCYVLRNTNFDNNFNLNFSDVALRYIKKDKIEKIKLQINEILVEKSGGSPTQPVGRVAIIKNLPTDKPTVFSNFLQKIVVDNTKFDPDYLFVYLQTLYKRGYMVYIQNQTTGIKNLIMNEFMDILVLKPEIVTQKKISNDYIKNMNTAKRMIEDAYILLENSIKQTAINIFK